MKQKTNKCTIQNVTDKKLGGRAIIDYVVTL